MTCKLRFQIVRCVVVALERRAVKGLKGRFDYQATLSLDSQLGIVFEVSRAVRICEDSHGRIKVSERVNSKIDGNSCVNLAILCFDVKGLIANR